MFKSFLKERKGGVIEWIILLSFAGIIVSSLFPGLRQSILQWAYDENPRQIEQGIGVNDTHYRPGNFERDEYSPRDLEVTVRARPQESDTGIVSVHDNESVRFSWQATGGSGHYELESVSGYSYPNNREGAWGGPQRYRHTGSVDEITIYTITYHIRDTQTNNLQSDSVNVHVSRAPELEIVAYEGNGSRYPMPLLTNTEIRFGVAPAEGSGITGNYTCVWRDDYETQGNSNCSPGSSITRVSPDEVKVEVRVCPVDSEHVSDCETLSKTFNVYHEMRANIEVDPDHGFFVSGQQLSFKITEPTGGSGHYSITNWENYNGLLGKRFEELGPEQTYHSSQQVVATVCDDRVVGYCIDLTHDFNMSGEVTANITANPNTNIEIDQNITFTANTSDGSGNFSYRWFGNTGNMTATTTDTFTTNYSDSGTNTIWLEVCDNLSYNESCDTTSYTFAVRPPFDSQDFAYNGSIQTFEIPYSGTYAFEVWGAEGGGTYGNQVVSGKGGYSYGEIELTEGTIVRVYVGGQGGTSVNNTARGHAPGGWNGGGPGGSSGGNTSGAQISGGGGGATDIRIGGTNLNNRILVAGGGGGAALWELGGSDIQYGNGGAAGGTNGFNNNRLIGSNATQSTGHSLGTGGSSYNLVDGGGGGGGYYGGYAPTSNNLGGGWAGGAGGGSSYIAGVSNGNTIAGNELMTSPDGVNQTGHSGDGHARISLLD